MVVRNLASLSNGCFRLVFGMLYDKLKFKEIYKIMLILNFIVAVNICYVSINAGVFAFFVFLVAAVEGGQFAIFSAFTVE